MKPTLPVDFYQKQSPLLRLVDVVDRNMFSRFNEGFHTSLLFHLNCSDFNIVKRSKPFLHCRPHEEAAGSIRVQIRLFDLKKNKYTIVLISLIFLIDNTNSITLITNQQCTDCIASVVLVETVGLKNCVENILNSNKRCDQLQSVDMEKDDEDENDVDVIEQFQTISLKCPMSYVRMKIPVRGINCDHLSCFDLENYIRNSTIKQSFNCPTCLKPLPTSELVIDSVLFKELKTAPDDVSSIKMTSNGNITEVHEFIEDGDNDNEKETDHEEMMYLNKNIIVPKPTKPVIKPPFLADFPKKLSKSTSSQSLRKSFSPTILQFNHITPPPLLRPNSTTETSPSTIIQNSKPPQRRTFTPHVFTEQGTQEDPIEL
ncbi:Sumo ligase [Entamoeba marina]